MSIQNTTESNETKIYMLIRKELSNCAQLFNGGYGIIIKRINETNAQTMSIQNDLISVEHTQNMAKKSDIVDVTLVESLEILKNKRKRALELSRKTEKILLRKRKKLKFALEEHVKDLSPIYIPVLTCNICRIRPVNRVLINCGHPICDNCLEEHVGEVPSNEKIPCPFCRDTFEERQVCILCQ